jgi:IrrE N-terminal-like domain/Chagasin family peptidase inhibitor I42
VSRRQAILEGATAAARLHHQLDVQHAVERSGGAIDVFGALLVLKAALLFRPLEGLLGCCIRTGGRAGVMISTQRSLRIQRFTGAHELGHVYLGHTESLDGEEILSRGGPTDEREIAANSFASAFLLPKWLLQLQAKRQGWNRMSMSDPQTVYQLALRVGASYEATCVALQTHHIVDDITATKLMDVSPRAIKTALLAGLSIENYFPDVWLLTERDEGLALEGQPDDLFILRLAEKAGAGYLWNTADLVNSGFAILRDQREIPPPHEAVGGPVTRALTARRSHPAQGRFALELKRPWQKEGAAIASLHLAYDLYGKEIGMPRAIRRQLAAA